MSVRTETLQLRVLVDGTPARRELAQMDQEYAKLNSSLKDLKKNSTEWKSTMERMDTVRARQSELRKEIGDTALTAKQLGDELKRLQVVQRNSTPNTQQWAENARRIEELKQRLRELNDVNAQAAAAWRVQREGMKLSQMTMRELELEAKFLRNALHDMIPGSAEFNALNNRLGQVDRQLAQAKNTSGGLRGAWGELKSTAMGVVGGVVGVSAAVYGGIRAFGDASERIKTFEQSLSRIKALGGEYRASIDQLAEAAKNAGTQFGFTANESIGGVEDLAKAGLSAQQIISGGLSGALALAASGNMSVSEAAEIAAKTMTQFGIAGAAIPHLADLLAAGAASATGEVRDLGEALKQSGQVVAQFGIPVEEGIGTLTAFASAGLLGSDAGTSFRTMLLRLANPSNEAAKAMEAINLQAYDANGNFVGMAKLAGQLQVGLRGMSQAQRDQALATIFGSDAIRAANVLMAQGEAGIVKYTAAVDQSGYAARMAAEQTDNWAGDQANLNAEWEKFVLNLEKGSGLISNFMRSFTQGLTGMVKELGRLESFNDVFRLFADPALITRTVMQEQRTAALVKQLKDQEQVQQALTQATRQYVMAQESGNEVLQRRAKSAMEQLVARAKELSAETATAAAARNLDPFGLNGKSLEALMKRMEELKVLRKEISDAGFTLGTKKADEELAALEKRIKELRKSTVVTGGGKESGDNEIDQKRKQEMERAEAELAAYRERAFQSTLTADERDLRQLDEKHRVEREKLKANKLATEADLLALDQQQATERANLIEAQGEERVKGYSEAAEKIRQATLSAAERTLQDELRKWDELISLAKKYGVDSTELEAKRLAAMAALNDKADTDAAKKFGQKSREQLEREKQAFQQRVGLLQEFGNLANSISGYIDAVRNAEEARADADGVRTEEEKARIAELNEQRKQAALVAIAVQGAAALANGVASAMSAPNWVVGVTQALATAGIVLGLMDQAHALMAQAATVNSTTSSNSGPSNVPLGEKGGVFEGPSHANDGLKVVNPHNGKVVAEVEGGEPWMVLSNAFRRNNPGILRRLMRASATGERLNLGERGGIFRQGPAFNFKTANEAIAMASGGVVSGGRATNNTGKGSGVTYSAGTGMRLADDDDLREILRTIAVNTGGTWSETKRRQQPVISLRAIQDKEAEQRYMKEQVAVKRLNR